MPDWTVDAGRNWILEKCFNGPPPLPDRPGLSFKAQDAVDGSPPWEIFVRAIDSLIDEGMVEGKKSTPSLYEDVKHTRIASNRYVNVIEKLRD